MSDSLPKEHIETILAHIGKALGEPVALTGHTEKITGGHRRLTYKLPTDHGDYVVSIATPKAPLLKRPHALQAYLALKNAPVPQVIGPLGTLPSDEIFQVSEFIAGKSAAAAPHTPGDMEACGKSLAEIHNQSKAYFDDFAIEISPAATGWKQGASLMRFTRDTEDAAVKAWLKNGTPIPSMVREARGHLRERAIDETEKTPRPGIAHKDAHMTNIIMTKDGRAIFIDLELAGTGHPLRDIARSILDGATSTQTMLGRAYTRFDDEKVTRFLAGYERVRSLLPKERTEIFDIIKTEVKASAALMSVRRVQLANFLPPMEPEEYPQWAKKVTAWAGRWQKRMAAEEPGNRQK